MSILAINGVGIGDDGHCGENGLAERCMASPSASPTEAPGAPSTTAPSEAGGGGGGEDKRTGRVAGGRFGPGNTFGKGNPYARATADLRWAVMAKMTPENTFELMDHLFELVMKENNLAAAKLLLGYSIGKMESGVNPDTVDQNEWSIMKQRPAIDEVNAMNFHGMDLEIALAMTRAMDIANRAKAAAMADATFAKADENRQRAAAKAEKKARRKAEREEEEATTNGAGQGAGEQEEPTTNSTNSTNKSGEVECEVEVGEGEEATTKHTKSTKKEWEVRAEFVGEQGGRVKTGEEEGTTTSRDEGQRFPDGE